MPATTIIKRRGQRPTEFYSTKKLAASVQAACLSISLPEGVARDTARNVCGAVERWLEDKPEVTSDDLRRRVTHHLNIVSPEAGYLYTNHQTIL